ncbi:von Willebrand factor D and EGF domain-containing protein-like [Mytilus edulis]|uniref:von Willebrand factor D and EGF domain-containing protein-like n=1 Tax=Mytilus edulis TaxID=6550 RepID=UPI0039EE66FC
MLTIKDYIESCITDIKSSGDIRFLTDTVMAIQLFSKTEAYRYNSMSDVSMLFQRVNTMLCVDNCNGNGQCISGKCFCNDSYIGISCSSHISIPPLVLSLPEDGLCDSVARQCRKTNIYGEFYSKDIICKSEYFLIKSSRKEYKASQSTSKALYRNFFLVTCDFEEHTNEVLNKTATIGTGFDISLSYDGIHFSRTLSLVIFNPVCMSCSSRPLNCHKKSNCGG